MGRPPKERSNKTSFSIPANELQKHSGKEAVRKLNEEFKYKGGRVNFKSTTKGQSIKLSHPDEAYLEDFRKRLFKELGLIEVGGEVRAELPGDRKPEAAKEEKPEAEKASKAEPSGPPEEKRGPPVPRERPAPASDSDKKALELIEEAVARGAIDDGQIIKYSYTVKAPDRIIQKVRKKLWGNKCRLMDKKCRFKRKQINFEETMKSCTGVRNECEYCESDLLFLYPQWKQNVDEMFAEFKDKQVRVRGKISYAKYVERDDNHGNHYKFLIYDTFVNHDDDPEDKEPKETRKLWARMSEELFDKLNLKEKFKMEDIVDIRGTVVWNEFFFDYWIEDITDMKVHEAKGEMPIKP